MNASKLDKIEAMLDALEVASGINPGMETIRQRDDGTWPEPETDADLIVEVVRFTRSPAHALADRQRQLAADVQIERERFARTTRNTPYSRPADPQSVGSANGSNDSAAEDAMGMQ